MSKFLDQKGVQHLVEKVKDGTIVAGKTKEVVTGGVVPASTITGVIDISHIPAGALERLVTVENKAARLKLTTANVQLGDTVKEKDTGLMYIVVDESKLTSEEGYVEYTAGSATSVPWSGVTGKPGTFTPSPHKHVVSDIPELASFVSNTAKDAAIPVINETDLSTLINDGLYRYVSSQQTVKGFCFVYRENGIVYQYMLSNGTWTKRENNVGSKTSIDGTGWSDWVNLYTTDVALTNTEIDAAINGDTLNSTDTTPATNYNITT